MRTKIFTNYLKFSCVLIYVLSISACVVNDEASENEPLDNINVKPTSDAGNDQSVLVGELVFLDDNKSFDSDNDQLTYLWTFNNIPDSSEAEIFNSSSKNAYFTPDVAGKYTIQLVVQGNRI